MARTVNASPCLTWLGASTRATATSAPPSVSTGWTSTWMPCSRSRRASVAASPSVARPSDTTTMRRRASAGQHGPRQAEGAGQVGAGGVDLGRRLEQAGVGLDGELEAGVAPEEGHAGQGAVGLVAEGVAHPVDGRRLSPDAERVGRVDEEHHRHPLRRAGDGQAGQGADEEGGDAAAEDDGGPPLAAAHAPPPAAEEQLERRGRPGGRRRPTRATAARRWPAARPGRGPARGRAGWRRGRGVDSPGSALTANVTSGRPSWRTVQKPVRVGDGRRPRRRPG